MLGLGVNVDLAPVLDVARHGGFIAAQHRGLIDRPRQRLGDGVAFAEGPAGGGVAATAKHFPGLGSTAQNTDFGPARIGLALATLRGVDERPYRASWRQAASW